VCFVKHEKLIVIWSELVSSALYYVSQVFSLKPAANARSMIDVDLRLDLKKVCSCSALSSSQ
jgi:hypothetical protein